MDKLHKLPKFFLFRFIIRLFGEDLGHYYFGECDGWRCYRFRGKFYTTKVGE